MGASAANAVEQNRMATIAMRITFILPPPDSHVRDDLMVRLQQTKRRSCEPSIDFFVRHLALRLRFRRFSQSPTAAEAHRPGRPSQDDGGARHQGPSPRRGRQQSPVALLSKYG